METQREIEPGVWLDARRALWLEPARTLVVADLHWGYAASHRAAGALLPAWGDAEIESTLETLLRVYAPREMIWLGDVIHAAAGRRRAEAFLAGAPVPVQVVRGNHDRAWTRPGAVDALEREGFLLRHGDTVDTEPAGRRQLVGHHHPAALLGGAAAGRLRVPALVTGPRRWIMPAFSPWAAGTPWNHCLEADEMLWAIAQRRIFVVPSRQGPARSPS